MKKGDEIYFAEYQRGKGYGELKKTTVLTVGVKYFTTSDNAKKILSNTMVDSHLSDPHKRYFVNEQHHKEHFELIEIKRNIREFSDGNMNIDIDDLRTIVSLIS